MTNFHPASQRTHISDTLILMLMQLPPTLYFCALPVYAGTATAPLMHAPTTTQRCFAEVVYVGVVTMCR